MAFVPDEDERELPTPELVPHADSLASLRDAWNDMVRSLVESLSVSAKTLLDVPAPEPDAFGPSPLSAAYPAWHLLQQMRRGRP